jgi:hypothetical protein
VAPYAVVSGGWAWHFLSPPHEELKLFHDHKDLDLLVPPERAGALVAALKARGYAPCWTRFDAASTNFRRYEARVEGVKVLVDVFVEPVDSVEASGVRVVAPATLLGFYRRKVHATDDCVAVRAARELLARGLDPTQRRELIALDPAPQRRLAVEGTSAVEEVEHRGSPRGRG